MQETQQIVELWKRAKQRGTSVFLATVVHVQGSSYRKAGARMLVTSEGERAGTISGGCLEAEVSRKIAWHTKDGASVHAYHSSFDDDQEGVPYGLGCGGTIWILMEAGEQAAAVLQALERAFERRVPSVVVAALQHPCGTAAALSGKALESIDFFNHIGQTQLPIQEAKQAFTRTCCVPVSRKVSKDLPEFLCMPILPPVRLLILGAGDDAQPIVRFGAELGWHVRVADGRSHLVRKERFPQARDMQVLSFRKEDPGGRSQLFLETAIEVNADDFVIILTHSYEQDRLLLQALLPRAPRYLGILGPLHRTKRLLASIAPSIQLSEEECLARLHAPVGLDIGSGDPATIALSIIAEIQAELMGKTVSILSSQRHRATEDEYFLTMAKLVPDESGNGVQSVAW